MLDSRYVISREYTGSANPVWVVRFCNDWVGSHPNKTEADKIAYSHRAARLEEMGCSNETIVEVSL